MMTEKKRAEKIVTFEESVKTSMGASWRKVSKDDKKVIHEMSDCQKKGGSIGSAVIGDEPE